MISVDTIRRFRMIAAIRKSGVQNRADLVAMNKHLKELRNLELSFLAQSAIQGFDGDNALRKINQNVLDELQGMDNKTIIEATKFTLITECLNYTGSQSMKVVFNMKLSELIYINKQTKRERERLENVQ